MLEQRSAPAGAEKKNASPFVFDDVQGPINWREGISAPVPTKHTDLLALQYPRYATQLNEARGEGYTDEEILQFLGGREAEALFEFFDKNIEFVLYHSRVQFVFIAEIYVKRTSPLARLVGDIEHRNVVFTFFCKKVSCHIYKICPRYSCFCRGSYFDYNQERKFGEDRCNSRFHD